MLSMSPFSAEWLHGKWWLFYAIFCMFCVCCRLLPHHATRRADHYDDLLGHSDSLYSNSDTNILCECDLWLKINSPWITATCWICLCNFHHTNLLPTGGCKRRPSLPSFGAHSWGLIVICLRPPSFGEVRSQLRHKTVFPVPLNISR